MDNNILKSEKKIQKDKMEEEEEFNKINDYSEESDEEQSGSYITALCPGIAEYPTEE